MGSQVSSAVIESGVNGGLSGCGPDSVGVLEKLFPASYLLLPQVNQIYELELAYGEAERLSADELIQRGAYFRSIDGNLTHHFRICMNTPCQVNASARQDRRNFFAANVFAVGYATHGLFPYRGKFHPQMIKAVMNLMGLNPGETILDPMAGCGTTSIEATLIGLDSISYELSPFAVLMSQAKVGALEMDCSEFPSLRRHAGELSSELAGRGGPLAARHSLFDLPDADRNSPSASTMLSNVDKRVRDLLLLCYLDAMGYARRRADTQPHDVFPELLERYLAAVEAFNGTREHLGLTMGHARIAQGDARELDLPDESVDGILFSPPYSFAIDYVENDRPQLEFLGVDVAALKEDMVGLTGAGRTKRQLVAQRVANYFADMGRIMAHCHRVLRRGRYCVIVIGSNINQTGGVSLEEGLVEIGTKVGLPLAFYIKRQIEGIRNTMRDEYLLFFRKPGSAAAPRPV